MNLTNQIPQNDSRHGPFNSAATPRQGQAGDDCILVAFDTGQERVQGRQIVGLDAAHPVLKPVTAQFTHHDGEAAHVSGRGVEFGAAGQDLLEPQRVSLGEVVGIGHDPAGNPARFGWWQCRRCLGRRCGGGGAEGVQVTADGLHAAVPAQGLQLGVQAGGVVAALVPASVHIRFEPVQSAGPVDCFD